MLSYILWSHNNVIDWNMDEFDEETDEAHDAEANRCGNSDFLEFTTVWLCATFHQSDGILCKYTAWFAEFNNLIHFKCVRFLLLAIWNVIEKKNETINLLFIHLTQFMWFHWQLQEKRHENGKVIQIILNEMNCFHL